MTEHEIEIVVERRMNMFDRRFMAGDITSEQYDDLVKELAEWARSEYNKGKGCDR